MKNLLMICLFSVLTACSSVQNTNPAPIPVADIQSHLNHICPLILAVNATIATTPGASQQVIDDLKKANAIVEPICSAGATVTYDGLSDLLKTGVPLLLTIVAESPIAGTQQAQAIIFGVNLAKNMLPVIIAEMPKK